MKLSLLFCAVMAALGVIASYPVLESGICDDFSYVKTSLDLARTGQVVYNGWATAMLGWQVYWGALIIKLFGFSFLAVRLSAVPFSMGSAALLFSIGDRVGLNKGNSIVCALALVLSPLFIPLAASFMTDVPAIFWILVGLYCCIRAITSNEFRGAVRWLTLCTLASLVGGTGRQTVWLGALVIVPSAAWLLRSHKGILKIAAALWIFSLVAILLSIKWFSHQPYSLRENLADVQFSAAMFVRLRYHITIFVLTTLLFSLPALASYLPTLRMKSKKHLLPLLVILASVLYLGLGRGWSIFAPWMVWTVTPWGVLGHVELVRFNTLVLTIPVRAILTVFVVAVLYAFVNFVAVHLRSAVLTPGDCGKLPWRSLLWLLGPFALAYLVLLLPRAASKSVTGVGFFDRYTIPLIPIVSIIALRFYQERIRSGVPIPAILTLAAFSGFAVASTHDDFAMQRAALAAASSLTDTGIPRTAIQGSWEYDGWTEMETTGHLNDIRIQVPQGAYHKTVSKVPTGCRFWFADLTPSVDPRYFLVSSLDPCFDATSFPSFNFQAWLPPFHRQVLIQTLRSQVNR